MKPAAVILSALLTSSAAAQLGGPSEFVQPDQFGWTVGDANTSVFEWVSFVTPPTPTFPNGGLEFPTMLDTEDVPIVEDFSGTAFRTGSGNLYSFDDPLDVQVTIPKLYSPLGQTILIAQVKTVGAVLNDESFFANGIGPVEQAEIIPDVTLGDNGPFGGTGRQRLYRFEVPNDAMDNIVLEFQGASSSVSLDELRIDTFETEVPQVACNEADLVPDGMLDLQDVQTFLIGFGAMDPIADVVPDESFDLSDVQTFLISFGAGCPN